VNQTTELISVSSAGVKGNHHSGYGKFSISRDGRFIVFESQASNLVSNDTNSTSDIFVRDRKNNTTVRINVTPTGVEANNYSYAPSMSCDGSVISFVTYSTNLVTGDINGKRDIIVIDRIGGNYMKNITMNADGDSDGATNVSCDGSTIVFPSWATNLVPNYATTNGGAFAYSVNSGDMEVITQSTTGTDGGHGSSLSLSGDGR
jgi:hypothetical protein